MQGWRTSLVMLAATLMSGCLWNTELPYQESLDTYVDSSETLLVQARAATDPFLAACKHYRVIVAAGDPNFEDIGLACAMDEAGDLAMSFKANIDAAIAYQRLLVRHSPDNESRRGSESSTMTSAKIAEECINEGSVCQADWITGPRLDVVQSLSSNLFASYGNSESHEALYRYMDETYVPFTNLIMWVGNQMEDMKAIMGKLERGGIRYHTLYCLEGESGGSLMCEHAKAIVEVMPDQREAMSNIVAQLGQLRIAHNAFWDEVKANNSDSARRHRLKTFAEGVVRIGVDIDQAF